VLEPISGYLILARKLYEAGPEYAHAWNFGPGEESVVSVEKLVHMLTLLWGNGAVYAVDAALQPHEAHDLKLDSSRARRMLGWRPRWTVEKALEKTVEWQRCWLEEGKVRELCLQQIQEFILHP
jgi:CDP-glucose 4,6-dehydratase